MIDDCEASGGQKKKMGAAAVVRLQMFRRRRNEVPFIAVVTTLGGKGGCRCRDEDETVNVRPTLWVGPPWLSVVIFYGSGITNLRSPF